jgi:ABC-type antimicrobial peptide transport system, permease component
MKVDTFVRLAARNIRHRGKRSLLTVIGVFIGVAAVVSLIALSQGLEQGIQESLNEAGANKITVEISDSAAEGFDDSQVSAVRGVRGVEDAAAFSESVRRVERDDQSGFASVVGLPGGQEGEIIRQTKSIEIVEGRDLRGSDSGAAIVSQQLSDRLFEDTEPLRSEFSINGTDFGIVGVFETGDRGIQNSIILPESSESDLGDGDEDVADQIVVAAGDGQEPAEVAERVERELRQARGVDRDEQGFSATTQAQLAQQRTQTLGIVQGVVTGIASISLLVGAVSILNTMYTSVTERTGEIGVMKAIGAKKRQILAIFLLESSMVGVAGGILGLMFGAGLAKVASIAASRLIDASLQPIIPVWLAAGAILFSAGLGAVSGILPARRAANLSPVDALREE